MSPVTAPDHQFCSECGQPRPSAELARFGDRLICPNCKSNYVQKLREGVEPSVAVVYGGFWIRFVAVLIDGIILFVANRILSLAVPGLVTSPVVTPLGSPRDPFTVLPTLGLAYLISTAMGVAYETFFIGNMGATPGKMALGLKVVRPDGSPVSYWRAAGRYFAKILSAIIIMIGYIMAAFDSQKRALHDMICDTRVIRTRN
jgi:uncharacterized RDD family membrane protein YckC